MPAGSSDHHDQVGEVADDQRRLARRGGAGRLLVGGEVDVGIHVDDRDEIVSTEVGEGRPQARSTDRRPVPSSSDAREEAVRQAGGGYEEAVQVGGVRESAPMRLGRLLEGQGCVDDSVEEGLVGFEAGIDEGDRTAQAGVAGEAVAEAPGDRRGARASGSGDGDEPSGPPAAGGPRRCSELEPVDAADGSGPPLEGAGEVVGGEVGGQHGRRSEAGPAVGIAADDQDGA